MFYDILYGIEGNLFLDICGENWQDELVKVRNIEKENL